MPTSREPSPVPSSSGDTVDEQADHSTLPEPDNEGSGFLSINPKTSTPSTTKAKRASKGSATRKPRPKKGTHVWIHEGPEAGAGTEDEGSIISTTNPRSGVKKEKGDTPDTEALKTIGTAVGTRRQANGTVGSVYSGSKIRHIKKADGTPLWRKEIQYEFLKLVVDDETPVFTRASDGKKECNFADIYIDCMGKSSKTSKVLKDRLSVDREAAKNMAMICLLVNVGRMNTTLNFFPEMRAQLRTYHSIPSLQAYKSQRDYKSLQDAPRLKSILKGASEDDEQPRSLSAIQKRKVPRTNAVNLIFILSQYAPKVSEVHFTDKIDFFDLAMRSTLSSKSRANAFLWLMWWYLESDFNEESALGNPFGPGEWKENQNREFEPLPLLVPRLVVITPEEGDAENIDTEEEKVFAERMTQERKRLNAESEDLPALKMADPDNKVLKRVKKSAIEDEGLTSDNDSRLSPGIGRSPVPDSTPMGGNAMSTALGGQADSLDDDWEAVDPHPGRGRYKRVKGKNTPTRSKARISEANVTGRSLLKHSTRDRGTPDTIDRFRGTPQPIMPPGNGHAVLNQFGAHRGRNELDALRRGEYMETPASMPKSRARTGYQRELEDHKNRRVEWLLGKRRREVLKRARQGRESGMWLLKAARRVSELPATYDSEDEDGGAFGIGGVMGRRWTKGALAEEDVRPAGFEADDYGEEAENWVKVFKRAKRRLDVWSGDRDAEVYQMRQRAPQMEQGDAMMLDEQERREVPSSKEIEDDLLAERSDEDMDDESDAESSIVDLA